MKYILIIGLAFASLSTTAFAGKPADTGSSPVGGDDGTGPGVKFGDGTCKGPKSTCG